MNADEVWASMMNLTTHNLRDWRRAVSDELGLPFGRVRVLRRLGEHPMGMKELADASGIDAPAATVAVNDLERSGLVERLVDPSNRRSKTVSLTPAGWDALDRVDRVRPAAPAEFAALDDADLEALAGILARVHDVSRMHEESGVHEESRVLEASREDDQHPQTLPKSAQAAAPA